ncbi:hypothetical protein ABZ135_32630 [Streptomyces sp. NPDC006339]|uniref:hypothetical protein n=1 Tax=Streptomyces sp. NPDC006339 TaxID=3156755 RepID=UPI0033AA93B0
MRTQNIEVGQTYTAQVPHSLPGSRYPITRNDIDGALKVYALKAMCGHRFAFTVTEIHHDTDTVTGFRERSTPHVDSIELLPEQIAALGLTAGPRYFLVGGSVFDADHKTVGMPYLQTVTMPARWLHPLGEPVPLPVPESELWSEIRAEATGMTADQVTEKAEEFQERMDRLQEREEHTYWSESSIRENEARRDEWARISAVMAIQEMSTYDPENDIESLDRESENRD